MQFIKSLTKLLFFICPAIATAQSTFLTPGSKDIHFVDRMEIKQQKNTHLNFSSVRPFNRKYIVDQTEFIDSARLGYVNTLTGRDKYEEWNSQALTSIDEYNLNSFLMNNSEWVTGSKKEFLSKRPVLKNFYTTKPNFLEVNTKNFDIERSIDGKNFIKVGTMPASGNTIGKTNYNFRDDIKDIAHVKLIYYRIRLNDIDDNFNLSNIVTARPVNDENILVYPSAFENTIFIEYTSADNSALEIVLTDVAGKTITKQQVVIEKGFNKLSLRNLEGVATGNYYIKIINQDFEEKYIIKVQKK